MSNADDNPISNAEKIIERFGGIRPMASKIDVPVTTVQGWKKRDVIPGNRRTLIIEAAKANMVDLSDILEGAPRVAIPASSNQNMQASAARPAEAPSNFAAPKNVTPEEVKPAASSVASPSPVKSAEKTQPQEIFPEQIQGILGSKELMEEIAASERKAVRTSVWAASALLALVIAGGAILLWPSAKNVSQQIASHGEQINGLEQSVTALDEEVRDVNLRSKFLDGVMPEDLQQKFEGFQNQAKNLQNTFEQIEENAKTLQQNVLSADAGNFGDRLAALEQQVATLTGQGNFTDLIARVRGMEQTLAGQQQLSAAMEELRGVVGGLQGQVGEFDAKLAALQSGDGALGQTLEGVSSEDLKAAAMLIAFSQFRDSLNREVPFESDLALLQKMVGDENPELQSALIRLAPHANGGVLSTQGLSNEFKGLAGDIVVASIAGEDVSFAEKAKARLGTILKVEKQGELIGGTDTQSAVARAQAQLDQGDVQGALATLQTLEGGAAAQAQPFIERAEAAVLADQVQAMIRDTILANLSSGFPAAAGGAAFTAGGSGTINLKQIQQTIESAIPGNRQVITDEESGVSILPQQPGFKGLTSGQ